MQSARRGVQGEGVAAVGGGGDADVDGVASCTGAHGVAQLAGEADGVVATLGGADLDGGHDGDLLVDRPPRTGTGRGVSNANRTSPFWDETKVRTAVDDAPTANEALRRLGYRPLPGHKIRLREACVRYGIEHPTDRAHRLRAQRPIREPRHRGPRWTVDDLRSAAEGATSLKQVIERLGLAPANSTYVRIERHAAAAGITLPARRHRGVRAAAPPRAVLVRALDGAVNRTEVLERLGWAPSSATYQRLDDAAKEYGLELPSGRRASGAPRRHRSRQKPLEEILVKGSTYSNTRLKQRLIEEGLLAEECAECHIGPEWNGKLLVLQLEHKDGDNTNNELDNLELLCPNCHSQTETFCRRKA